MLHMPKRWTKEDEEFLLNNIDTMSREDLAEKLGVTAKAVSDKYRRLKKTGSNSKPAPKQDNTPKQPLDVYNPVCKDFIRNFIYTIDYRDIAEFIGADPAQLKEIIEKTGISLPIERARPWKDINVGTFKSLDNCARCQVQCNHPSFYVGINECRACYEKNITMWIERSIPIHIKFQGFD